MKNLFCALGFLAISGCSFAASRHQNAVVTSTPTGLPCLSVPESSETRKSAPRIAVIDLYDRKSGKANALWKKTFLAEQGGATKQVPLGDCIEYPSGEDAPNLVAGMPYNSTLWAFIDIKGETHRRWYSANFCMIRQADGSLRPHQVLFDRRRGVWAWEACDLKVNA